jgi:hypothetical protein
MKTRTTKLLWMYLVLAILIGLSVAHVIPSVVAMPLFLVVLIVMMVFVVSPYVPPLWVMRVAKDGKKARATVLENEFIKSSSTDLWVAVPVEVKPADEPAFKVGLHCKTSQAAKLEVGSSVSVRYDPVKKLALLVE